MKQKNEATLTKKGKYINSKKNDKKSKKSSPSLLAMTSKAMPYILTVLFVVLFFSLVGLLGNTGLAIKGVFYGLFSNFASYFLPFFMLYHALMWYYDVKRKICFRRVFCSFIALFGMSTLQHIITSTVDEELSQIRNITELYNRGMNGQGGGVIGGLLTRALTSIGGNVVAIIIIFLVLALMLLQMFNITPWSIIKSLFNNDKQKNKDNVSTPNTRKPKTKHKNVDIFDDDEESETTTIDLFDTTDDSIPQKDDSNKKHKEKSHNEKDYGFEQLTPYDKNKDYTAIDPKDNNSNFIVVKTKFEDTLEVAVEEIPDEENRDKLFFEIPNSNDKKLKENLDNNPKPDQPNNVLSTDDLGEEVPSFKHDTENPQNDSTDNLNKETFDEETNEETFDEETEDVSIEELAETDENDVISYVDEKNDSDEQIIKPNDATEKPLKDQPKEVPNNDEENNKKDDLSSVLSGKALDMINGKEKIIKKTNESASLTEEFEEENKVIKPSAIQKKKVHYKFPSIDFLVSKSNEENEDEIREELQENARKIVTTLNDFSVRTRIVDIARGPTVTRYEIAPEAGVRVKAISSLADDIALNLAAEGIRIESPIPGKSAVGIEVPNKTTSFVFLKDLISSEKFQKAKGVLTCGLGKSISGENIYVDIEKTPHLLVAGATGMGKSVCINSILISLLYKASPEDLRLILIDPKRVELSNYNGIPHLLVPVVCEPKKSLGALQWAVTEMEKRFEDIEKAGVRNLIEFNEKVDNGYEAEKMSRIVIVIDELADLKMAVPDIEGHITRLTQKARAAGIHIIIGTQRPSVDVITGLIKNNIPSRIAFRVPSQVDSRTILDEQGAEKLVSRGDMLVKIVGALKPVRVQGAFVSAPEIEDVINFLKSSGEPNYDESVMQQIDNNAAKLAKSEKKESGENDSNGDELDSEFYNALRLAAEEGKISSSQLQRKLRLGFQRAARIIDQMYDLGYIGEPNGSKPRDVLIDLDGYREIMMRREDDNQ